MKNIWLIDDDAAAHTYHKVMIDDAGYDSSKVTCFYDVENALSKLRALNEVEATADWPAFIFLDINMPLKSGYDFIFEFEGISLKHKTPIIYFVSSTKNPIDIKKIEKLDLVKGFETKFLEKEFFQAILAG